jgi:hypothetical protein
LLAVASVIREMLNQKLEGKVLAGHERYPLTIAFYVDPEWQVWHQTRDPLKEHDKAPTP